MPINWNLMDLNRPRQLADIFNPASQRMRAANLQSAEEQVAGQKLQNLQREQQIREAELARQQQSQQIPQMQEAEQQKKMEMYSRQIDSMIANDLRSGMDRKQVAQRAAARSKQLGFTNEQIAQGLEPLQSIQDNQKAYEHFLFASNPELAQKEQMKQAFAPQKRTDEGRPVQVMKGGKPVMVMSGSGRVIGEAPLKTGETAGAPKLTEAQAKATTFASQMAAASNELGALESAGYDPRSLSAQVQTRMAGGLGNIAASPEAQRAKQAQNQWSEAFLRVKTGAAATQPEVELNNKTFFPQFGDSADTIEQKRRMRAQAEQDVLNMAAGGRELATKRIQPEQTQDAEAIAWARANPNDPRAGRILKLHGM